MLDNETKRRIDTARDILVGKVPDPKSQVEQITIALIYKFMDDMDAEAEELGGKRKFFSGEFDRYGWKKLMAPDLGGFDVLTLYAEAIQKMNINPNIPQLFRDIFKNAYLPYRDPETLKSFLKIIDDFEYTHSEKLGDAFEYLLSVLGSQGDAGQFRTPRHIIDFMVDIIDPKKDETILDPACGTAGFLISSYKHILKHNSTNFVPEKDKEAFEQTDVSIAELSAGGTKRYNGDKLTPDERAKLSKNIKGYDISPDMVRLSLVNLYLHGFTDPKIFEYDTLTSEDNWNEYADIVLANPPFMSPKGGIKPHKRFSILSNRSEVLFVDYMVEHLTPNGKAAIIVPEGIIFQSGNAYKQLRKMLIENYLFAVVSLPAGVFQPYSGVKTSILLIDKALNKKTDKILFVKIENDGFDLGAQRRPNNKSQLPTAVKLVKEYISGCNSALDVESILTEKFGPNNLWNIATKEKIAENDDWNLSGERYKESKAILTKYKTVLLGEVADVDKGTSITKKDVTEGIYPVIAGGQQPAYYHNAFNRDGNIITVSASGAYAGFVAYFDKPIFASDCSTIKAKNEDTALTKFLYHLLKANQDKIYLFQQGMGQPHVYAKDLIKLEIPLPPLEIQKEIVAEIEGWQKIIDGARQVVENYKPQIDIDPEWPMVELGNSEIFQIEAGGTPSTDIEEYWNGNIAWATLVDLPAIDYISEIKSTQRMITDKGLKNSSAKLIPTGSIIVSTRASIGRVGINKIDLATNQGFKNIVITNKAKADSYFIALMLKRLEDRMNELATGGTFKELSKSRFVELSIPLPSLALQREIVARIRDEKELISSNKVLITIFEQKIKDKIAKVWGE